MTEKESTYEASADWLFEQLEKKQGRLRMERGLDEVRFWADGMYHVMDTAEFDEIYYQWEEDWEDREAERWQKERDEEEQQDREDRKRGNYRDYTDDFADDYTGESAVPQVDDPQPKNSIGASEPHVCVQGVSSARVRRSDLPICFRIPKPRHHRRSRIRNTESRQLRGQGQLQSALVLPKERTSETLEKSPATSAILV